MYARTDSDVIAKAKIFRIYGFTKISNQLNGEGARGAPL